MAPPAHNLIGREHGGIRSLSDLAGFAPDAANQLTQAVEKNSGGTQIASYGYGYDYVGNMTSMNVNGTNTTLTYNAADELTGTSGGYNRSFTYDGDGRWLTSSDATSLAYNAQDQTTSITPPGGSATSMTYSGAGESQRLNYGSTSHQYDATGLSAQTSGSTTTLYTTLPDGSLISETVSGNTYYYLGDGSGNVAGLTDSTGTLRNTYGYDPQGNPVGWSEGVPNSITFQGGMYDSTTNTYRANATILDPRFQSPMFSRTHCRDHGHAPPMSWRTR